MLLDLDASRTDDSIQLLDCFLTGVILLLDGRMVQSLDPEVKFTATTFLVHSTATSFSVLAGMVEGRSRVRACSTWRPSCKAGLSTILCGERGDLETLLYIFLLTS